MKKFVLAGLAALTVATWGWARAVQTEASDRPHGAIVVENGRIALTVNHDGELVKLVADGEDLLRGQKGYWQANAGGGGATSRIQYVPLRGTPEIRHRSGTYSEIVVPYGPTALFPCRAALHYVLRSGERGFFVFIILEHTSEMPRAIIDQFAFNLRLDPRRFNYIAVSDDRRRISHPGSLETPSRMVTDATYLLPDGRIVSKYDYVVDMLKDEHHVFGWAGGGLGVWLVQASGGYITGAPAAQMLSAHQTMRSPIIVWQPHSRHFGTSAIDVSGDWHKVYGPVFWYINRGGNVDELWADAKAKARQEEQKWPYSWMTHPFYVKERGQVKGRLVIANGATAAGGLVFLAGPGGDWYRDWRGYVASARIDSNGEFVISNVIPGTYVLYSDVAGLGEEFQRKNVRVDADSIVDLDVLNWNPQSNGVRLWQIGIPDRSAAEFRNGSWRHWGNWELEYPEQFPHDVNFVIGKSRERMDWNYLHPVWAPPYRLSPLRKDLHEFYTRSPIWRIIFDSERQYSGTAYLTIGFAGMRNAAIDVSLNGRQIGHIDLPYSDSAGPRGAARGAYFRWTIKFGASELVKGRNIFALEHAKKIRYVEDRMSGKKVRVGDPYANVLYDYISLEVAR